MNEPNKNLENSSEKVDKINPNENEYFQISPIENQQVKKTDYKEKLSKIITSTKEFMIKRWWVVLIASIALAVLFVSLFAYLKLRNVESVLGDYQNVIVRIEGPDSLPKGSPGEWKVFVDNRENTPIENIEVNLEYDSSFEFIRAINPAPADTKNNRFIITRLDAANSDGVKSALINFQGTTKGSVDEEITLSGQINYTPQALIRAENQGRLLNGQSSRISKQIPILKTKTTAAKVELNITTKSDTVQNNSEAEITAIFKNTSEREIRDLRIRTTYPNGFTYTSAELSSDNLSSVKSKADDGNNIWNINSFARLSQQTLKFRGNVFGAGGASLNFVISLEIKNGDNWQSVVSSSRDIKIAEKPLVISTQIEGRENNPLFTAGETLNLVISYENQGSNPLKNLTLQGSIEDPADILDWNSIQFNGGDRGNIENKQVKWGGQNIPQLANLGVKVKGQVRYSIKVKQDTGFLKTFLDQNKYIIIPQASILGDNIQELQTSGTTYKATADLFFEQEIKALPQDPNQANKKRFNIKWTLKSLQNNIINIKVATKSGLPPSTWTPSSIFPQSKANEIQYNSATGEITWSPNGLAAFSGYSREPVSISFDLVIETALNSPETSFNLFNNVIVTGTDEFTSKVYQKTGEPGVGKTNS
jgi:hypothetical protein